jgi:hypothetical protein
VKDSLKDPHGRQIIGCVENDLINLDMFKVEMYDTYTTLQAPISYLDAIHIANVVGSVIITSSDLVVNVEGKKMI